jgi:hypothetical protein
LERVGQAGIFILMNSFALLYLPLTICAGISESSPEAIFKRYVGTPIPVSVTELKAEGYASIGGSSWAFFFRIDPIDLEQIKRSRHFCAEENPPVAKCRAFFLYHLGHCPSPERTWQSFVRRSDEEGIEVRLLTDKSCSYAYYQYQSW